MDGEPIVEQTDETKRESNNVLENAIQIDKTKRALK